MRCWDSQSVVPLQFSNCFLAWLRRRFVEAREPVLGSQLPTQRASAERGSSGGHTLVCAASTGMIELQPHTQWLKLMQSRACA